jgi:bifunctional UDP-N-acetylglucosamine pyrophosphorylase / glucosamine-1-phosphate N-acetyltransferase
MPIDNSNRDKIAAIIMAAGRGSRMKGYAGNKTLLPLIPHASLFEGDRPLLLHLMDQLPDGPRAVIVHHCKEDVMQAASALDVTYCEQPQLNGTGGAIIAAQSFIQEQSCDRFIITMGDVPFVSNETYARLVSALGAYEIVVLGFRPLDKKQYGVLEIEGDHVRKITEWKFWKDYSPEAQAALSICNSGIYAVTQSALNHYLPILASRPQVVHKEINGRMTAIEEFFITDIVEYMVEDGKAVGFLVAEDETETMGIDDVGALEKAQAFYRRGLGG